MSHTENGAPNAPRSENTAEDRFLDHADLPEAVLGYLDGRTLSDFGGGPNRAWHKVVQGHAWLWAEAQTLPDVKGVWERFRKEHPSKPLVIRVDGKRVGYDFGQYLEDFCGEEGLCIVTPKVDVLYANGGYSVIFSESSFGVESHAFYECSGLTSVVLPSNCIRIEDCAFYECRRLASVTFRGTLTSIGRSSFENCRALTSVTFPEGLINIGDNAFRDCTGITSVVLPSTLHAIGGGAFYGCRRLTPVVLPMPCMLRSIGHAAFCTGVTNA